ncbi:MAG TPA: pilus assembly protein TadG-related protein [Ilumatobacter sp.]|nr:pilus assembly protein TadG-related protein [Ilumatobacter sp.]
MIARLAARLRDRGGDDRGSVTVWAIGATVGCMLLVGLLLDGGAMLRARSDAFALASAAARAGAQHLDSSAAVEGITVLDPVAAEQAALEYLAGHGATGTVTVTAETITVTVTSSTQLQLLSLVGADNASFSATSTANVVKVDLP